MTHMTVRFDEDLILEQEEFIEERLDDLCTESLELKSPYVFFE